MEIDVNSDSRGQWGSSFGFIMAAAGSAVGLGNIWRFPYVTGTNGGGAFVFVYLLCVVLIGIPLLLNEMALGRMTRKNPIGAFKDSGGNGIWVFFGAVLAIAVSFLVLSYYGVIAGWTIGYVIKTLFADISSFEEFAATSEFVIPLMTIFMMVSVLIVIGGVSGGIERAAKVLMPILFLLVIVVIIRGLTLPGAGAGVKFYLYPDFSKLNAGVVLSALGQAFFSMSVGWGIMITYGSYLPKTNSIVTSGVWVGFMDTLIALLGGLMIFPAVFAFGKQPDQGPTLIFQVLPEVFSSMPGGTIIGAVFFLLLMIAALTSSISMLEVPASYLIDEKKWSRKKSAWVVGILVIIVGIPSALSAGGSKFFTEMTLSVFGGQTVTGFLDIMDYYFGTLLIVIVALSTALYSGWGVKTIKVANEIADGSPGFVTKRLFGLSLQDLWIFFIRFICPLTILFVLLNMVGVFG